jgi:hypothetical protein
VALIPLPGWAVAGYTPTVIVTNQTELNTELAKTAVQLEGQVIGVQYNATPYVINRNGTGSVAKNYGVGGLVICGYGGTMPTFSSIEISGCTNLTLYGIEVTSSSNDNSALIYMYTSVNDITINSCKIHGPYHDPNGDYVSVAYPSFMRGIGSLTSASNLPLNDITITNNEIYDLRQGIELNKCGNALTITGNSIYRCYIDGIQLSNFTYTPTSTDISWNEIHDLIALEGDVGNPHGDYIQFVGVDDWLGVNVIGNIIYKGSARGSGQGIFADDFNTGKYMTANVKGNLISIWDFNRGLSIQQAKNCNIIGNTVVMAYEGQTGSPGLFCGEYSDGGGCVVKNNVAKSFTVTSATATNNHTISAQTTAAYGALFVGPAFAASDTDTRARVLATFSMKVGGPLDQTVNIGAVGSGYVNFDARTLNTSME